MLPLHRRRRIALSVSAALLAGAPLLTACGSDAHAGAAAVVGGQRIEVSAVQGQVRDVRAAQSAAPQGAELIKNTDRLSQFKLNGMIFDRILQRAADDAGVKVSRNEVQTARRLTAERSGGEEQFRVMALQQAALTPEQIDAGIRRDVLLAKVTTALGGDNMTSQGQKMLLAGLAATSKKLGVDVNPRYGTWDYAKVQLSEVKTPWVKQKTRPAPQQEPTGT